MPYKKDDVKRRMDGAFDAAKQEFSGLRTGRASAHMLEHVTVEAYGSRMPINQCGSVTVPEPRMLTRASLGHQHHEIRRKGHS